MNKPVIVNGPAPRKKRLFNGESSTSLRIRASLELLLWTVGIVPMIVLSILIYGLAEFRPQDILDHIAYCFKILRTGER